ncbi:MAG: sulfite exporter TauE/SafE family protein [Ignavibacteriae bacterium]|nr:sulfite exporter TauE/SafE family protein [Ignavibacteriota bacterium]
MDIFNIYLPVAEIQFNVILLFVIGFCVGVLGGFFGVGGGWIVTPALNMFGFPMDYAIGTDITHIFGKSIVATKIHSGLGNVDWKLGIYSILSSVIGVEVGAQIIMYLKKTYGGEGLDVIVRWSYIILLVFLGSFMLYDYFVVQKRMSEEEKRTDNPQETHISKIQKKKKVALPIRLQGLKLFPMISFKASGIKAVSFWIVFVIFFIAGVLQGFLGVGGGFIKMPAMIYLLGVPTVIAVGTDLFNVLITSIYGGFSYAIKGRVELIAAVIMFFGGAFGAIFGSTATKYVRGYGIRLLFAIMIIVAGGSVVIKQLEKPLGMPLLNDVSGYVVVGAAIFMTTMVLWKLVVSYYQLKKSEMGFDPELINKH